MSSGVTSYDLAVQQAVQLKTLHTFWGAVGRTAAWTDENNPPDAERGIHAIDTPIVYVVPTLVSLAKAVSSSPDVTVGGQGYALVTDQNAYSQLARFIYLKCLFSPDDGQPYANFRQAAVYCDLVPASGHENDLWLSPANVTSPGRLVYYQNRKMTTLGPDDGRQTQFIIICE